MIEKNLISSYPNLKLNYWAVPKSANTTIKLCLNNPTQEKNVSQQSIYTKQKWVHNKKNIPHISVKEALTNNYLNFSVVRHPYDRLLSLFKDFGVRRPWKTIFNGRKVSLDQFIDKVCVEWKDNTLVENKHAYSQAYYLTNNDNKLLVEKIIDIEKLDYFFANRNIKIGVFNKTTEISIILNQSQKNIIYKRFEEDFDFFKYQK